MQGMKWKSSLASCDMAWIKAAARLLLLLLELRLKLGQLGGVWEHGSLQLFLFEWRGRARASCRLEKTTLLCKAKKGKEAARHDLD